MFDWIKKLFETKNEFPQPPEDTYELTEDGLKITRREPTQYYGKSKITYPVKVIHISEPIYSFGEAVKVNPKRFKILSVGKNNGDINGGYYSVTDRLTKKKFTFHWNNSLLHPYFYVLHHSWITSNECQYLAQIFNDTHKQRRERINQIKRDRLKKVYCENKKKPCPTPPPCRIIREGRD